MAQSPLIITGLSTVGVPSGFSAVATAYLGGLYRNIQASIHLTSMSSLPEGTAWITAGPSTHPGGVVLLQAGNPSAENYQLGDVHQGFFEYVQVWTDNIDSSYFGVIQAKIYFDGPQWPSS